MINPPLSWFISVLTDPATGVNAQLANVPRPVGQDRAPDVLYYDSLQNPWAARAAVNRDALRDPISGAPRAGLIMRILMPDDGISVPALPEFGKNNPAIVPCAAFYVSRKVKREPVPANSAVQLRDVGDTLRTCVRCLAQKFEDAHASYDVDQCVIMLPESGVIVNTDPVDWGDDEMLGCIIAPLQVEDRWALGIT